MSDILKIKVWAEVVELASTKWLILPISYKSEVTGGVVYLSDWLSQDQLIELDKIITEK